MASRAELALATATADLRNATDAENQARQRLERAVSALNTELQDKSLTDIMARELVHRGQPWVAANEAT